MRTRSDMPNPRANNVEVQGVFKTFSTQQGGVVHALDNINLRIEPGEFVSIVGPSGCGKSTLMRLVCGLAPVSRGHILVGNKEVKGTRDDVGVVFQNPVLLPWLTVQDNILMAIDLRRRPNAADRQRAQYLLQMTGLQDFAKKYPFELSGGMRQRVSICRALMSEPRFLAMDEPFGALDAMTRETMNLQLMSICAETGATVLFITHSVNEAVLMSDRVIVMTPRPGRVVDDIRIDLPRPRSLADYGKEEFYEYTSRIRRLLGAETLA